MEYYKAYLSGIELLALRGFTPNRSDHPVSQDAFENFLKESASPENWKFFNRTSGNHPSQKILFGMTAAGIGKENANIITNYILTSGKRKNGPLHIFFIHGGDIQSAAQKDLSPYFLPKITRQEAVVHFQTNPVLEFFHVLKLQFNPMKFALQPEMRLLSDAEMTSLHQSLVAPIREKNKQLEDLLPILTAEGPIALWHGAFLNDVFFFHRTLEGDQAYYRIVRPGPPKMKKNKSEKTE
jgi:hypothetical protein